MNPLPRTEAEELPLDDVSDRSVASSRPIRTPDERGLTGLLRIIQVLERHPWALPASVPILVAIKVLRVAEGDIGTAQVIFGAQGVAGLTSSILMGAATPALLVALLVVLVSGDKITAAKAWGPMWGPAAGLGSMVIFIHHPCWVWILMGIGVLGLRKSISRFSFGLRLWFTRPRRMRTVLLEASRKRSNRRRARRQRELWLQGWWPGSWLQRTYRRWVLPERPPAEGIASYGWPGFVWMTVVWATATALASAMFLGSMWAPAEQVTLKDAPTLVVGYVLSDDGNRVVILLEADRSTASYRSDEIEARQRCELTERQIQQQYPEWSAGLVSLLYHPSSAYPDCPS